MAARTCAWCRGLIPSNLRADAVCCSTRCRQARHRFTTGVGGGPVVHGRGETLRLAYADPPYPGKSQKYYGDHPDYAGEIDHAGLIRDMVATYDGWALSTSASALQQVLALCPPGVRVASWTRGARGKRRSRWPLNGWEPVVYWGGRPDVERDASRRAAGPVAAALLDASEADPSFVDARRVGPAHEHDASRGPVLRTDSLVYIARPRTTDPNRVVGAKPAVFCRWIFDLLGALPGDEFVDIFPGSGGVQRAWDVFAAPAREGAS